LSGDVICPGGAYVITVIIFVLIAVVMCSVYARRRRMRHFSRQQPVILQPVPPAGEAPKVLVM